ncbi:MAG TPA: hypothetical protein VJ302_05940 [Blastocatellia bacterium]|nr:hypothetical protein [Blastocatellia bacterium]
MSQSVKIRNVITGEFENIELSQSVSESLMKDLYELFGHLKLEGPIAEPLNKGQLISPEDCKDYADDLIHDEQQYRLYLSKRTWEQFDLADAAFLMSYLHVAPKRARYSALPFIAELILRAGQWSNTFDRLVSRLRDDFKPANDGPDQNLCDEPTRKAILALFNTIKLKAEENWKAETVTVIERAIRDLKRTGP